MDNPTNPDKSTSDSNVPPATPPSPAPEFPPEDPQPASHTAPGNNPKRVLVVDDDPSVREMIGRVLEAEGYVVFRAASGPEAIALTGAHRFDLALIDLNMPGQGGWDTFETITSKNPLLPVMIITARPHELFVSICAGVGALLEKPLDFPMLLHTASALMAEPEEKRNARRRGDGIGLYYMPSTGQEPPRVGVLVGGIKQVDR